MTEQQYDRNWRRLTLTAIGAVIAAGLLPESIAWIPYPILLICVVLFFVNYFEYHKDEFGES